MSETGYTLGVVNLKAAAKGFALWRNQVGSYKLADGRWLSSGLGEGSSDLIGFRRITITQEMVGDTFAQFAAVEVKKDLSKIGKMGTKERNRIKKQRAFIDMVNNAGGVAFFADDTTEIPS